jgi:hypothetical protein
MLFEYSTVPFVTYPYTAYQWVAFGVLLRVSKQKGVLLDTREQERGEGGERREEER